MKKIINGGMAFGAICLFLTIGTTPALAASHTITAEKLIPPDISIVYQINTEVTNPLEEFVAPLILEQINGSGKNILSENELNKLIKDNIFTFAIDTAASVEKPDFYASLYMSKTDFDSILTQLKKDGTIKEIEYNGEKLYVDEYDTAVTFINSELFLVSNNSEKLKAAIDLKSSLATNENYLNVTAKDTAGSFFKMYVNPASVTQPKTAALEAFGITGINADILAAMKAESISVTQTGDGFQLNAVVKTDGKELQKLNLNFDKYNFTPSLYKLFSGENLILYSEETNLKSKIEYFFKTILLDNSSTKEMDQMKVNFKDATAIDVDDEIMPLLEKGIMLTVHDSKQLIPGITLTVETGTENIDKATGVILKLSDYLKKQGFTYGTYQAGGTTFYELSSTAQDSSFGKITLYLRMGVTNDGYLVISTVPNLTDIFRKDSSGILATSSVSNILGDMTEKLTGVCFFSTDNLRTYLNSVISGMKQQNAETISIKETINAILEPWHEIYSKSYNEQDLTWGIIKAKVDVTGFKKYGEVINSWMESINSQYIEPALTPKASFCDVASNSWYYKYVTDLAEHDVVAGYQNGCFCPDQPITRAEFVTLLMKATKSTATIKADYQPFKDVPAKGKNWYSQYVDMAAFMQFITGYDDGTFHPDANISRAEALQIIYNMSRKLPVINTLDQPLTDMNTFSDVKSEDWFFTPIVAARHYGLIQGVTQNVFEPNRNITRAEASKIVKLFLELENQ
jgi:hypothetical protein